MLVEGRLLDPSMWLAALADVPALALLALAPVGMFLVVALVEANPQLLSQLLTWLTAVARWLLNSIEMIAREVQKWL